MVPFLDDDVLAVDLPPKSIRGGPGRHVLPPESESLTVRDFAESLMDEIDSAGLERCVLVGHSMGGLSIAEIARLQPNRVAHLVFVSCMVPPEGGSSIAALPSELREMAQGAVDSAPPGGTTPVEGLDEATIRYMFCNDMDETQTRFVLDHVGSEVPGVLGETVTRAGIPSELPKTYIKLLRDQSLPPDHQDQLVGHLRDSPGGEVEVITIDAGHDVIISQPRQLAAVLNRIATQAG